MQFIRSDTSIREDDGQSSGNLQDTRRYITLSERLRVAI